MKATPAPLTLPLSSKADGPGRAHLLRGSPPGHHHPAQPSDESLNRQRRHINHRASGSEPLLPDVFAFHSLGAGDDGRSDPPARSREQPSAVGLPSITPPRGLAYPGQ